MTPLTPHESLTLPEEILLLSLQDKEGTIVPGTMYRYALGGAILSELLLHETLRMDQSKKNRSIIDFVDSSHLGIPFLDECLEKIRNSKRRGSIQTWVQRFASISSLKQKIAAPLCERGILQQEQGKVLFIFNRDLFKEADPRPEATLIKRLRSAVLEDSDVHPRTLVLVSLAKNTGLLRTFLDKSEIKASKARVEYLANGDAVGKATKGAIEATQAAVMVACITPIIITSH